MELRHTTRDQPEHFRPDRYSLLEHERPAGFPGSKRAHRFPSEEHAKLVVSPPRHCSSGTLRRRSLGFCGRTRSSEASARPSSPVFLRAMQYR
jgi:hypothetical protein